jgi:hypothetical protein
MKKISIFCASVLLISCEAMAQRQDKIAVKPIIEKGSKGDLIIGNKHKQQQLRKSPEILAQPDSLRNQKVGNNKNGKKQRSSHK